MRPLFPPPKKYGPRVCRRCKGTRLASVYRCSGSPVYCFDCGPTWTWFVEPLPRPEIQETRLGRIARLTMERFRASQSASTGKEQPKLPLVDRISAGELRRMGAAIPEEIPDEAVTSRDNVVYPKAVRFLETLTMAWGIKPGSTFEVEG